MARKNRNAKKVGKTQVHRARCRCAPCRAAKLKTPK